ncbi:hypothetical protein [Sorangium cellulosum]|uniref:Uncharacterized protein n=1 Tax=Sorangium cellulosum TaxID=56 RepID=A0A150QDW0_SORCE|nr:hypothetical protein [Sorangium cellulosum]KYF66184.1 hypothetical protein BE15_00705 [Sorangium cellulosum]
MQYGQRYGSSSFHHNIVIGTGDLFVELFPTRVAEDPRAAGDTISFTDNYFADTSLSGVYTHAVDTGATIRFERNTFLGFHFNDGEVYPDTSAGRAAARGRRSAASAEPPGPGETRRPRGVSAMRDAVSVMVDEGAVPWYLAINGRNSNALPTTG